MKLTNLSGLTEGFLQVKNYPQANNTKTNEGRNGEFQKNLSWFAMCSTPQVLAMENFLEESNGQGAMQRHSSLWKGQKEEDPRGSGYIEYGVVIIAEQNFLQ